MAVRMRTGRGLVTWRSQSLTKTHECKATTRDSRFAPRVQDNLAPNLHQRLRLKAHDHPICRSCRQENRGVRWERLGDLTARAHQDDRIGSSEVPFLLQCLACADCRAVVLAALLVCAARGGLLALEVREEGRFRAPIADGAAGNLFRCSASKETTQICFTCKSLTIFRERLELRLTSRYSLLLSDWRVNTTKTTHSVSKPATSRSRKSYFARAADNWRTMNSSPMRHVSQTRWDDIRNRMRQRWATHLHVGKVQVQRIAVA